MNLFETLELQASRRTFLSRATMGIGTLALSSLLNPIALAAGKPARTKEGKWLGIANPPHFAPKAKRIIFLTMAGGPSHLETLDYKPKLAEMNGQPMPESYTKGQQIAQLQGAKLNCLGPQHTDASETVARMHYGRPQPTWPMRLSHLGAKSALPSPELP